MGPVVREFPRGFTEIRSELATMPNAALKGTKSQLTTSETEVGIHWSELG